MKRMAQEEAKGGNEQTGRGWGLKGGWPVPSRSEKAKDGQREMGQVLAPREASYYKPSKQERKQTAFRKENK